MRFGMEQVDITPPFKTSMGGYAGRQGLFESVHDPVTCTVMILEEQDRRVVLVAADLVSFYDARVSALRQQLAALADTVPENVLLNASHTHGGPELRDKALYFDKDRDTEASARYQIWMDEQICKATEIAMSQREEGSLWRGCGKTSIPMNRRLKCDGEIVNAPNPDGSVDDRLQLLAIKDQTGTLRALGIRVSCHPVATSAQELITADFPGAFRVACIEKLGDSVVPFFLQGAGGDMRPRAVAEEDHWRMMPHDELPEMGCQLLDEALAVLNGDLMEELQDLELSGHFEYARAPCERRYTTQEDFQALENSSVDIERLYAKQGLRELADGHRIPDGVDIAVQTIWITKEFPIIGIQGEVLIDLGAYVEACVPRVGKTMLLGYCNGCVGYLPDTAEMRRGGYEQSSYLYSGWTGPLKEGLEQTIAEAVHDVPGKQRG